MSKKTHIQFDLEQFKNWFDGVADVIADLKTREQCDPSDGRVYHTLDSENGDIVEKWHFWFGESEPDKGESVLVNGEIIEKTAVD